MYTVNKCIFEEANNGKRNGWILEHDSDPYPFYANKYLHFINVQSTTTNREYAYKLCKFLNYIEAIKHKHYSNATQEDLIDFLDYITYGGNKIINQDMLNISYSTISLYSSVISSFYNYLYKIGVSFDLSYHVKKVGTNKNSFMYGQNWNNESIKFFMDKAIVKSKKTRNHIKWYKEEQTQAILDSLNTFRDKAIFSFSCDGMRIDEILSIMLKDYSPASSTVIANRSKGKETGNTGRVVSLSKQSVQLLEEYLYNERITVEENQINEGIIPSEYLFINLKHNKSYGKPVTYRNYLQILKTSSAHCGLDPKNIRTHSGRSTKAMELFKEQSKDPALLSDQQIADMMGWSNINSAKPYKNKRDEEVLLANWSRLNNAKQNRNK